MICKNTGIEISEAELRSLVAEGSLRPIAPNDRHIASHMTGVPPLGNGAAEASQARSSVSSIPPASADRSERFLNRLDRELVGLDRVQRNAPCRQIENWEARYSRFIRSQGKSEFCVDLKHPIDAADFMLTLAGLHKRWNSEV